MTRPEDPAQSQPTSRSRLLGAIQVALALALLAVATLPLSAPAVSPEPAQADVDFVVEEASDEGEEEEWELEEEEEEGEEEEFGTKAMAPLPPECLLRTAAPTVVAQFGNGSLRLDIHYTARTPTRVAVDYWLKGGKGSLQLGPATRRFDRQGTLHVTSHLDERELAKVRAARVFIVDLDVPNTPSSCEQYLTLRLDARDVQHSRGTWSERKRS